MRVTSRVLRLSAVWITIACAGARSYAAEDKSALPQVGIGYEFAGLSGVTASRPDPVQDPLATQQNPLYARIEILWGEVEKKQGEMAWEAVDALVDRFRAKGHEPILDLWGGNLLYSDEILRPPLASETKAVEAWEAFIRQTAKHFKDRVRYYQIGKTPNSSGIWGPEDSARSYAFVLKKSAVIVRSEVKNAVIVGAGLSGADSGWLERFFAEDTAPYIDIVSFRPDARSDLRSQVDSILAVVRARDAADSLWVEGITVSGAETGRSLLRSLLTVFDHGATAAFFALPYSEMGFPNGADVLARAHSALPAGMGRVPSSDRIEFLDPAGQVLTNVQMASFYNPETGLSVTGYWTEDAASPANVTARLTARRPGPPMIYDPLTGRQTETKFQVDAEGAKGDIPLGPSPQFLVFREGVSGLPESEGKELLAVSAERGITAEEVIAHYREFQAAQDPRLRDYISDAMINFHFRIAGSSRTIDVGMGGSYFFDPKGGSEWEIRDYYLNGNKSRWKEFPELPLIQPEKVLTLPLDITFDRSYTYVYDGEDRIEGRDCYVLAFEPVDPSKTLYRGKVWIEKATWSRVRVSSIQTRLEPPFLSSEEKTTYSPVPGPDGQDVWLVTRIDGQQIYSASGRNFIVLRDIVFSNFRIDDPDFEPRREMAHDSQHQMLKDTDRGLRYLEKDPEGGGRRVKENFDTNQLFGLVGVIKDPSLSTPIPLLGVNYFDYDFKKKGIQVNLFFAGALTSLNVTNPNIGQSGFDLGMDLFLSLLSREDKDYRAGEEISERRVKRREQSIAFNLGRQAGNFVKLRAKYDLSYQAFDRADDTDPAYVLPKDTILHTSTLYGTFDRSGYEVRAQAAYSVRKNFEVWGDPCQPFNPSPPGFCTSPTNRSRLRRNLVAGEDFDPHAQGFYQYEAGASKEFFLPSFQKLRFGLDLYSGSDLDRFSRYQFDRFGAPLKGFAGSGIRFDRGGIARAAYVFNLANLIRFEVEVDQARVKTLEGAADPTNHTGIGLSANVLGPWKTVWQLDYGYALRSDVKPVEGDQELLLVILKLF